MPIKVTCEKCGGVLHAPDDAGGKKGRCPNCQNILPIPIDASRAPAFGATGPAFGTPAAPPPGMAFASPAPINNPMMPNADSKRPIQPPFGSGPRPDTSPGLASSTPGLGANPTFGTSAGSPSPHVQSSMPFGAPRMNPSATMPIQPERVGWISAASGLRLVQWGVMLCALALLATFGLAIFSQYGGQSLAAKPGMLKWENLSQLGEIKVAAFTVPSVLGLLLIAIVLAVVFFFRFLHQRCLLLF